MDYEMPKEKIMFVYNDKKDDADNVSKIKADSLTISKELAEKLLIKEDDAVNHPAHYTHGNIEVIDIIRDQLSKDQFVGYCLGNALKYVCRCQHKGKMIEDIKKAIWYLNQITEN